MCLAQSLGFDTKTSNLQLTSSRPPHPGPCFFAFFCLFFNSNNNNNNPAPFPAPPYTIQALSSTRAMTQEHRFRGKVVVVTGTYVFFFFWGPVLLRALRLLMPLPQTPTLPPQAAAPALGLPSASGFMPKAPRSMSWM